MIEKIKVVLKNNNLLYYLYNKIGSSIISFLGLFFKLNSNQVIFVSYGGVKFDDSPRVIYESLMNNPDYSGMEFVWAFTSSYEGERPDCKIVNIDSLTYLTSLLRSKYWITNTTVKRGLNFRKKGVIYVNTWHGTPLKKVGQDVESDGDAFKAIESHDDITYFLAQSDFETEVFSRAFNLDKGKIVKLGLPRNQALFNNNDKTNDQIKLNLGIPKEKKVILYAPTFRDFNDSIPPINFEQLELNIGEDFVLLLRFHHAMNIDLNDIATSKVIFNVSNYSSLNDLMVISDVLISDYSSIVIDYSILERPILLFTYDIDEYKVQRGLYDIFEKTFSSHLIYNEEDLMESLKFKTDSQIHLAKCIKQMFIQYDNQTTNEIIDLIFETRNI